MKIGGTLRQLGTSRSDARTPSRAHTNQNHESSRRRGLDKPKAGAVVCATRSGAVDRRPHHPVCRLQTQRFRRCICHSLRLRPGCPLRHSLRPGHPKPSRRRPRRAAALRAPSEVCVRGTAVARFLARERRMLTASRCGVTLRAAGGRRAESFLRREQRAAAAIRNLLKTNLSVGVSEHQLCADAEPSTSRCGSVAPAPPDHAPLPRSGAIA